MDNKTKIFSYDDAFLALSDWAKNKLIEANVEYEKSGRVPFFIQYLNYQAKLVRATSRKVTYSKEFSVSPENQKGFDSLCNLLTTGKNVNAYLSKSSLSAKRIDGMLDNFGIKHFHLGDTIENGFIKRTKEIALGLVTDEEVFFILSKNHGKGHSNTWYETDVLEILHKQRPDLIEHCKVTHMCDLSNLISNTKDIKNFRDSNINAPITLDDGTSYMPFNLGQTTAGFPIMYTMKMQSVAREIFQMADDIFKKNVDIKFIKINQLDLTSECIHKFVKFKINDGKKEYLLTKFRFKKISLIIRTVFG